MVMFEHWKEPEGGPFSVAIPSRDCQAKVAEVEAISGRGILTYSHALSLEHMSYVIFFFKEETDAKFAMSQFDGEPFDIRNKGRGKNWMKWMKGRGLRQNRKQNPYKW